MVSKNFIQIKFCYVAKVFVFFGKSKSLFGELSTRNCKNSFLEFLISFLTKFSFLKVHFKGTGKKLCQFFMNKIVCISRNSKVG